MTEGMQMDLTDCVKSVIVVGEVSCRGVSPSGGCIGYRTY